MKKVIIMLMVVMSMATGCAGESINTSSAVDEIQVNEIEVKPITVNEIEVTTWDNVDIETFE